MMVCAQGRPFSFLLPLLDHVCFSRKGSSTKNPKPLTIQIVKHCTLHQIFCRDLCQVKEKFFSQDLIKSLDCSVLLLFRLHYVWIDIGTPNASFLVALDAGSDLLWLPCDCVQCAPLSSSYYSMLVGCSC